MNYEFLLRAAIGLRHLGLFDESELELLQIPPGAALFKSAQAELLITRLSQGSYQLAAETGLGIMEREEGSRQSVLNTSLALIFLGRLAEARDVMLRLPNLGELWPNEAYQMACLETRLGNYPEALIWLGSALAGGRDYSLKALIDSDLQPLWQYLEHHVLSRSKSQSLQSPAFADLRERSTHWGGDLELDGNDLESLPDSWRHLFRFVPAQGTYSIHALTSAAFPQDREACEAWFRARAERSLRVIERACNQAAPPQQGNERN